MKKKKWFLKYKKERDQKKKEEKVRLRSKSHPAGPAITTGIDYNDPCFSKLLAESKPITQEWADKMKALTKGVEYDIDKPLDPKDD